MSFLSSPFILLVPVAFKKYPDVDAAEYFLKYYTSIQIIFKCSYLVVHPYARIFVMVYNSFTIEEVLAFLDDSYVQIVELPTIWFRNDPLILW